MKSMNSHPMASQAEWNVDYHYLYGRRQLYRYLPDSTLPSSYQPPDTDREFFQGVPELEDRGPQTVEQLITQGYFRAPAGDPETALLSDKQTTSWLGLDDVIHQVQTRLAIYERNTLEIEQAKCYAMNDLFAFESRYGWPASTEQHYILGKRLQQLYADQRAERVSLWKDVSRLRQALPEHVQGYLGALRKLQVLQDSPGDAM